MRKGQVHKSRFAYADTCLRYETVRFLVPEIDGVNVPDRSLGLPLDRLPAAKGVVFIDPSRRPSDPPATV